MRWRWAAVLACALLTAGCMQTVLTEPSYSRGGIDFDPPRLFTIPSTHGAIAWRVENQANVTLYLQINAHSPGGDPTAFAAALYEEDGDVLIPTTIENLKWNGSEGAGLHAAGFVRDDTSGFYAAHHRGGDTLWSEAQRGLLVFAWANLQPGGWLLLQPVRGTSVTEVHRGAESAAFTVETMEGGASARASQTMALGIDRGIRVSGEALFAVVEGPTTPGPSVLTAEDAEGERSMDFMNVGGSRKRLTMTGPGPVTFRLEDREPAYSWILGVAAPIPPELLPARAWQVDFESS